MAIAPKVLTVRELSNYLRVHPSTIYRLLKKGSYQVSKSAATGASTSRPSTDGGWTRAPTQRAKAARNRPGAKLTDFWHQFIVPLSCIEVLPLPPGTVVEPGEVTVMVTVIGTGLLTLSESLSVNAN